MSVVSDGCDCDGSIILGKTENLMIFRWGVFASESGQNDVQWGPRER